MDEANRPRRPSLRMGETQVDSSGQTLYTLLGSCIGLALYDAGQKIGGLAHILLPDSRGKSEKPGKFVDTAIPFLIKDMQRLTDVKLRLTARIAGGASMFATESTALIGEQNMDACRNWLAHFHIPLIGQHCGGNKGRRMSFHTDTGLVVIEIVGEAPVELPHPRRTVPQR